MHLLLRALAMHCSSLDGDPGVATEYHQTRDPLHDFEQEWLETCLQTK